MLFTQFDDHFNVFISISAYFTQFSCLIAVIVVTYTNNVKILRNLKIRKKKYRHGKIRAFENAEYRNKETKIRNGCCSFLIFAFCILLSLFLKGTVIAVARWRLTKISHIGTYVFVEGKNLVNFNSIHTIKW